MRCAVIRACARPMTGHHVRVAAPDAAQSRFAVHATVAIGAIVVAARCRCGVAHRVFSQSATIGRIGMRSVRRDARARRTRRLPRTRPADRRARARSRGECACRCGEHFWVPATVGGSSSACWSTAVRPSASAGCASEVAQTRCSWCAQTVQRRDATRSTSRRSPNCASATSSRATCRSSCRPRSAT